MQRIRDATFADLDAIVAIYNAHIPGRVATADTELISVESWHGWFHDRDFKTRPIWILERDGKTIAWLNFKSFYGRPAYVRTAELGLYVQPEAERTRAGSTLLARAIASAPEFGVRTLLGFIFSHNVASLALFEKFGFREWGKLPGVAVLDELERDLSIFGLKI